MVWELRVFVRRRRRRRRRARRKERDDGRVASAKSLDEVVTPSTPSTATVATTVASETTTGVTALAQMLADVARGAERRTDTYILASEHAGIKFRGGRMDRVEVKERLDVDDATGSELWSKTKVKTKKLRKKGHPGVRADWSSFVTTAKARVSSRHPHAADVHVEHAVINVLPQTIPAMALEAVRDLDSWLAQLDAVLSADATKISSPDPQAPVQQWHSVCFESGSRAALQAVAHDLEPLATLLLDSAPTSLRPAGDDGDDADVDAGADVDAKSGDARRGDCDVECVRGGYPSWIVHVAKNHSQHSE